MRPTFPANRILLRNFKKKLPDTWQATLRAIDGSRVDDVYAQLKTIPKDSTHLILSIGGNNALSHINILDERVASSAQVFSNLADISGQFEQQYQKLLQEILSLNLPTTLCTIYNPRHPEELYQRIAVAALATFNDVIIRQAFQAGIPLIDLRLTCNEARDYANPIEPSAAGGEKIANTILNVVLEHDFRKPYTQVFY